MDRHNKQPENEQSSERCAIITYQSAAVSVPVSVIPKVNTGDINTFCCGEPTIIPSPYKMVHNSKSGICNFILRQNLCIEIPIEFSAESCVGCPSIDCIDVSAETL